MSYPVSFWMLHVTISTYPVLHIVPLNRKCCPTGTQLQTVSVPLTCGQHHTIWWGNSERTMCPWRGSPSLKPATVWQLELSPSARVPYSCPLPSGCKMSLRSLPVSPVGGVYLQSSHLLWKWESWKNMVLVFHSRECQNRTSLSPFLWALVGSWPAVQEFLLKLCETEKGLQFKNSACECPIIFFD